MSAWNTWSHLFHHRYKFQSIKMIEAKSFICLIQCDSSWWCLCSIFFALHKTDIINSKRMAIFLPLENAFILNATQWLIPTHLCSYGIYSCGTFSAKSHKHHRQTLKNGRKRMKNCLPQGIKFKHFDILKFLNKHNVHLSQSIWMQNTRISYEENSWVNKSMRFIEMNASK